MLLVKNEEHRLPHALASIPAGAPVIVVDTGSTDRSAEIARRAGAQTVDMPFEGFVRSRRAALALVRTPWTFMLDADERLDGELRVAIASADETDRNGFLVSRRTWLCAKPISGCGWGDERLLRLVRTEAATIGAHPASGGTAELHERWSVAGKTPLLAGRLEHDSYPTIGSYFGRFARYTAIEARGLPRSLTAVAFALFKAPFRMLWLFFVRSGWRDGWRGAFVSFFSALYPVVANARALLR